MINLKVLAPFFLPFCCGKHGSRAGDSPWERLPRPGGGVALGLAWARASHTTHRALVGSRARPTTPTRPG